MSIIRHIAVSASQVFHHNQKIQATAEQWRRPASYLFAFSGIKHA